MASNAASRSDPLTDSVSKRTSNIDPSPVQRICLKARILLDRFLLTHSTCIFGKLDPTLLRIVIFLAIYLGLGTLCFSLLEPQMKGQKTNGIIDAIYFCIVTMATVGYGDIVPDTVLTKLLVCAFAFMGMALVALGLTKAGDYLLKMQGDLLVKVLHLDQNASADDIDKLLETKGVKRKCFLVSVFILVLIIAGTAFLATVEKMNLINAFYCVCVTVTTLGYGDNSFKTKRGRIFAVFWILLSTISMAQLLCYIAELCAQRRKRDLVKRVLSHKMTNADLEQADLDKSKAVE
jgi:potassium channel subfamily K